MNIDEIQVFCDKFKISHYALDVKKTVVHKKVFAKSDYKPLIYFIVSEHMYPITNKKVCSNITHKEGNTTKLTTTSNIDKMEEANEKMAERLTMDMVEIMVELTNQELYDKLMTLKDCNVFINRANLYDFFVFLFLKSLLPLILKTMLSYFVM